MRCDISRIGSSKIFGVRFAIANVRRQVNCNNVLGILGRVLTGFSAPLQISQRAPKKSSTLQRYQRATVTIRVSCIGVAAIGVLSLEVALVATEKLSPFVICPLFFSAFAFDGGASLSRTTFRVISAVLYWITSSSMAAVAE